MYPLRFRFLYSLITLFLFLISSGYAQQKKQILKAEYFEEQLKLVNTLKNTNPDSAYKLTYNLIKTAQTKKLTLYEAKFLLTQGTIQYQKDKNTEAELLFKKALLLFKKSGDLSGEARVYNNLGILAREANDIEKSLMFQNKGLQIRLAINDPLVSSSYNNIASIYLHQGNYPKAITLFLKELEIAGKYLT